MQSRPLDVVLATASLVFKQPVRAEDTLFELAVDSLTVIEYCGRLERSLGISIDVEELFAAESLGSFGAALAARLPA